MTERTILELVRHAQARPRDGWRDRPDEQRPLTDEGHAQSRLLARSLASDTDGPVVALYSSPFVRCVQTLEPLAERLDLPVRDAPPLGEAPTVPVHVKGEPWVAAAWLGGRALGCCDRIVADHAGGRVVACSHGDVVPALLAALAGRDGLDVSDLHAEKGGGFRLRFDGGRCEEVAAFTAPDPSEASET